MSIARRVPRQLYAQGLGLRPKVGGSKPSNPGGGSGPGLLAVGSTGTPFLTVYNSALVKLAQTWTTPAGAIANVCISANKRWIAIGVAAAPFLQIYDCSSGVPVLVTPTPGSFSGLTASPVCMDFTPDNTKLLVGDVTTPFFYIFTVGGSWPQTGTIPTLSVAPGRMSMHPDGTRYSLGFGAAPWFVEYTLATGAPTSTFGTPLSSICRGLAYNRDDSATDYLVLEDNTPALRFYNAGTAALLTNPGAPTAGNPNFAQHALAMNGDGSKLLVAGSGVGGGGTEYRLITRAGTVLSNGALGTVPTDPIRCAVWSRDGTKLLAIVTGGSGNFLYSYDATSFVKDANNANMPVATPQAIDCSW